MSSARQYNYVDMTGQRVGSVLVLAETQEPVEGVKFATNGVRWLVRCDCGNQYVAYGYVLRSALREQSARGYRCAKCRFGKR